MHLFIKKIIQTLYYSDIFVNLSKYLYESFLFHDFNKFVNRKVKNNTILITEAIYSHAEVIPGLVKYCLDLGYNTDILITDRNYAEKPLEMFKNNKKVMVFNLILPLYIKALHSKIINEYKYVVFSSSRVYYEYNIYGERFVIDYINNVIPSDKIILMEHHLDLLEEENKQKYKMIALPEFCSQAGVKMVNSHYFGKTKKQVKNKITKFIVVGAIEQERKNYNLLISAAYDLLSKGINNFEILVIGKGELNIERANVRKKIKCTGRISYESLYKHVQESDYILALLDPNNQSHERYKKDGTSGMFQLSYGFFKPMIIHEHFAVSHGLTNENAIIYTGEELASKMEFAVNQTQSEYKKLVDGIKIKEQDIYKKSLENMESFIGRVK